jgi:hypothetical protein
MGMGLPRHHRHGSGSVHPDAGCARGQTSAAHPHCDCSCPGQIQCVYRTRSCFRACETALSACGSGRIKCEIRSCGRRTAGRIRTRSACGCGGDYAALAQALVDAGATTKPAAVVASILSAHAEGTALNRIASDAGIHHKTVSKIIDAAENHRQRLRVAV